MVFAITNAKEYRKKVEKDLSDLAAEIANSSRAINAVTSTFHIHEWLWAHVIKPQQPVALGSTSIKTKREFLQWLDDNCPHFKLIQDMANGSKHAYPVNGSKVQGFGVGPYGIGPWGAPYLLIDTGEGIPERYLVASEVIKEAGEFMVNLSKQLGA